MGTTKKGCRSTMADENLSWGSIRSFMGTDGPTRMATACVSRAALGGAACAWVAVPMYRVKFIPEDAMCVIEAQRGKPRTGDACPSPWLAEQCSAFMPALMLTSEQRDTPEEPHPLPKVLLGPSLRDLVSRGTRGVSDADLLTATGITALDVSDNPNVTTVAPFAGSLRKLTACGLCGIGDSGVAVATSLEHLESARNIKITNLAPFSTTLQHVGGYLTSCYEQRRVDLSSPMPALSSIGDDFLSDCSGITAIDLAGLANVTRIGDGFMSEMSSLTALDLRPLQRLESVGDCFLNRCSGITAIDLAGLANVTRIGDGFMNDMTSLTALDLRPLQRLESVGDGFFDECSGLESSRREFAVLWEALCVDAVE